MPSLTITGTAPTYNGDGSATIAGTTRVTCPSTGRFTATQGWVAMRIKPSTNASDGVDRGYFSWGNAAGADIWVYKRTDALLLTYRKFDQKNQSVSWLAGDHVTIVFAWTATNVYQSLNGANFLSAASTDIPVAINDFWIGYDNHDSAVAAADYYWFAAGSGTLSNADAATLHGFGDTDPTWAAIPGTPTVLWTCTDATYQDAAPSAFGGLVQSPARSRNPTRSI